VRKALSALLLLWCGATAAQDLTFGYGRTRSDSPRDATFGWSLSYAHDLSRHFAVGLAYQNEGHVPGHHRDGFAPQVWARLPLSARFSLAAGVGPYRYFDTIPSANAAGYEDRNGWGVLYSAAARYDLAGHWLLELRYNRTALRAGMDTDMLLLGLGYRLEKAKRDAAESRTELFLLAGRSIVNSFESEAASAWSAELRHRFGSALRGSLAWIDEGHASVVDRQGLAAQAWLEPTFYEGRLSLGAGWGPYFAKDRRRAGDQSMTASIASLTASWRFARHWSGRITASRVISRYDRDADLVLVGLGYRF
jgi:hypothetical protein